MQIYNSIEQASAELGPTIITIGNFDGVHLGHQKVIQQVVNEGKEANCTSAVITFRNHPLEILKPEKPIKYLCTAQHKKHMIENLGVDTLFNLEFTQEFSEQDPETFLVNLKGHIDYRKFIFGYDARIGKGRQGDKEKVVELAKKMDFEVEHLEPFLINESPVSSSLIRESIKKGDFSAAKRFLGRPYSILSTVVSGRRQGRVLGYPTANLDVSRLCLPPFGVYTVEVLHEGIKKPGIANLGVSPTIKEDISPLLEVYIFEKVPDLYGKELEVFFDTFLRPEIKFSNIEELRKQITRDIEIAKERKKT